MASGRQIDTYRQQARQVLIAAIDTGDSDFENAPLEKLDAIGQLAGTFWSRLAETAQDRQLAAWAVGRVISTIDPYIKFDPALTVENWFALIFQRAGLNPIVMLYKLPSEIATTAMALVVGGKSPEQATAIVIGGVR